MPEDFFLLDPLPLYCYTLWEFFNSFYREVESWNCEMQLLPLGFISNGPHNLEINFV